MSQGTGTTNCYAATAVWMDVDPPEPRTRDDDSLRPRETDDYSGDFSYKANITVQGDDETFNWRLCGEVYDLWTMGVAIRQFFDPPMAPEYQSQLIEEGISAYLLRTYPGITVNPHGPDEPLPFPVGRHPDFRELRSIFSSFAVDPNSKKSFHDCAMYTRDPDSETWQDWYQTIHLAQYQGDSRLAQRLVRFHSLWDCMKKAETQSSAL